jgi:predicted GNAT family N-acyltransferase
MITIEIYSPKYKADCLLVFKSNMPKYFLLEEYNDFNEWLDEKTLDDRYFVCLQDNQVVACGGYFYDDDRKKAGLSWGMVNAALHGTGIGTQLTAFRVQEMKETFPNSTYMIDTSQHTAPFYPKMGFVTQKVTPNGFGEGLDKHYMEIEATPTL